MENTHVVLTYQVPLIDPIVVSEFEEDVRADGLNVRIEPVPFMQYRAGIEWLVPTAVIVYIAKPYFDSFLSEMGKDHYAIVKTALNNLRARISARYRDRLKVVSSSGKFSKDSEKYSPIFSIEAESSSGYRYKLLIQTEIDEKNFSLALDAFLDLMAQDHRIDSIEEKNECVLAAKPITSVVLLSFNPVSGELEIVDPLPKRK